jgi:hypothetical protein
MEEGGECREVKRVGVGAVQELERIKIAASIGKRGVVLVA